MPATRSKLTPALVLLALVACGRGAPAAEGSSMKISSGAFENNARIAPKYTCDGKNISPPLAFENVPAKTASLALVVDDPDAPGGTFDHWVVWNIPPDVHALSEGETPKGTVGRNGFRKNSWGGPCPPSGQHHYHFKLFALDTTLDLPAKADKAELERAMKDHVLEQAELVGVYTRAHY